MAERTPFTGFDLYKLTGVRVTDRELGRGSYATVVELEYVGLRCAGKKIHDILLRQGDNHSYTVHRFEEECRILSQVRHPNIVQFLGLYFQQEVRAPILVMEFLPSNLTSCIEQYGILAKEIGYSILHDVALGLYYLHSQSPPIIHRDLSSNNVLLTPNMTAKISDLGVARILNLTPLQISRMTRVPGTPTYMPPEVMIPNPKYNTSVDQFSYGILMIHIFSGQWPEPKVGQTRMEGDTLIPVSEAERREVFLQKIGNDHPLIDLIHRCISNDPRRRADVSEILKQLAKMMVQYSASFTNRLEMLQQIESDKAEMRIIREEREEAIQVKEQHILNLTEEAKQKSEEIHGLNMSYSNRLDEMKLEIDDLNSKYKALADKNEAEIIEYKAKIALSDKQLENTEKFLQQEKELARTLVEDNQHLKSEMSYLQSQISDLRANIRSLQHKNSNLETEVLKKEAAVARMSSELDTCTRNLQDKNAIVSGMKEQLCRAREYLTSRQQVSN